MPASESNRLTHPELLSESELREILENRCIDISNHQNLPKSKLIELYNRIALPLPQRQSDDADKSNIKNNETANSVNESEENSDFLNGTSCTKTSEVTKAQTFNSTRAKSPSNEVKHTQKKIRLCDSNKETKCNGTADKRPSDEKHEESPGKKRQKITWP